MNKRKPPVTRTGKTHTMQVADVEMHITVNKDSGGHILEVFAKASHGEQGSADMVCKMISLGLQNRLDVDTVIRHMRGDRTPPCGCVGQPTSIYSAIAEVLAIERGES